MKQETTSILQDFFSCHAELAALREAVEQCVEAIAAMHKRGNKLLLCGNGGSAADCEHIAGELLKSFRLTRGIDDEMRCKLSQVCGCDGDVISSVLHQGVKVIPLTGFTGYSTAFNNDCNALFVYAQLVNVLGAEGDVLLAISTSGNSANVVYAAQTAKAKGMTVVGLTGAGGGKLKRLCDILINVPQTEVYKIQECHLPVYHAICLAVERELFQD